MNDFDFQRDFETVVIRLWKGKWVEGCPLPPIDAPPGGFVLTFHRGVHPPYKAEHYATVRQIKKKYPQFAWMKPMVGDAEDIVLVGI